MPVSLMLCAERIIAMMREMLRLFKQWIAKGGAPAQRAALDQSATNLEREAQAIERASRKVLETCGQKSAACG